jgi:hypothetical protein
LQELQCSARFAVSQFSASIALFSGPAGGNPRDARELDRLDFVIDVRDFRMRSPPLGIRRHSSVEVTVTLTREQFAWIAIPGVCQFPATRGTQTGGGVFSFIQQTQELADVPQLVPQSICQFRDPPYLNALLPELFTAAPIDANHYYCYNRLWHYGTAEAVQLIQSGLGQATSVYALLLPSRDAPSRS